MDKLRWFILFLLIIEMCLIWAMNKFLNRGFMVVEFYIGLFNMI